jgi:hypothetical protein
MATSAIEEQPSSHGFDFSNHARNQFLGARMGGLPKGQFLVPPALKEEKLTRQPLLLVLPSSESSLEVDLLARRKVSALGLTRERQEDLL